MKKKKILFFALILTFILAWSLMFYFIGPLIIIDNIGIQNSYIFLFFAGIFSGISLFFSAPYYETLSAFSSIGLNFIILGIIGGVGLTIGDSIYYYFGKKGEEELTGKIHQKILKFSKWLVERKYLVPIVSFLYFGFTPFPNGFLIIPLGLSEYPYKKLLIPLLIGNIALSIFTARYLYQLI